MVNPQFTNEEGEPPVLKDMLKITLMVKKTLHSNPEH